MFLPEAEFRLATPTICVLLDPKQKPVSVFLRRLVRKDVSRKQRLCFICFLVINAQFDKAIKWNILGSSCYQILGE